MTLPHVTSALARHPSSSAPHALRARCKRLPLAIGVALLVLPTVSMAATVGGGATATVQPGDPVEAWTVTGNSTLNIIAGGATGAISLDRSSLTADGGP